MREEKEKVAYNPPLRHWIYECELTFNLPIELSFSYFLRRKLSSCIINTGESLDITFL